MKSHPFSRDDSIAVLGFLDVLEEPVTITESPRVTVCGASSST